MKREKPHIVPQYMIYGFFILGLISAFAFRIIIVLQRLEPEWVRPVWYIAVSGYLLFFLYRYEISRKRKRAVREFHLIEKLKANACLQDEEREVLIYLLTSIKVSLEDLNYAIIFLLSLAAIAADIILLLLQR